MNNVFDFQQKLIDEYSSFSRSFTNIAAPDIKKAVDLAYENKRYWPDPLIQINPHYKRAQTVDHYVKEGTLHPRCFDIFRSGKDRNDPQPLLLYKHQEEAIAVAQQKQSYVVTTGTGSGKSLSFFIPMIDRILREKDQDSTPRTRAIVIYPMNALANSQLEELGKFLCDYTPGQQPVTVRRYTGQDKQEERQAIAENPPDILLTNFMMLELILTRCDPVDLQIVEHCQGLDFLVLDELHTYRGRQGADVALLVRRLRERLAAEQMICIGTSATMSSADSEVERNLAVAGVAGKLFGITLSPTNVIGETLERVTNPALLIERIRPQLASAVQKKEFNWPTFADFQNDPLAVWVELTLGIEYPAGNASPRRARPKTLSDAARCLSKDAGCDEKTAAEALKRFLLDADKLETKEGRPPFAFRLHQFISGPGKVYTTLEEDNKRTVTLDAQRFAEDKADDVPLFATHFCRDCGQEYLPVWHREGAMFEAREIDDVKKEEDDIKAFGFLCPVRSEQLYQGDDADLPENWLELDRNNEPKLKNYHRKNRPQRFTVDEFGKSGAGGRDYWFMPGKFHYCLNCGQFHDVMQGRDINRLSSLSGEGRSSATTVLTLSALRQLFDAPEPAPNEPDFRKLLGFTDNRQDAALQAGHFNDFINLLTLRAALVRALETNNNVLNEQTLASAVFRALGFDSSNQNVLAEYLNTASLRGPALTSAKNALTFIIGYRLFHDLRRGWRFNNPNLSQLKLLEIKYMEFSDFCKDDQTFAQNQTLSQLTPEQRQRLFTELFDRMRENLCLETRYLSSREQEEIKNSSSHLNDNWRFQTFDKLQTRRTLVFEMPVDTRFRSEEADLVSAGPRSTVVRKIKNLSFWSKSPLATQCKRWKGDDWSRLVEQMLKLAQNWGYVQSEEMDYQVNHHKPRGWRLIAQTMEWHLNKSDGQDSNKANRFFRNLYCNIARLLENPSHHLFEFEAQEHTAQVDAERRKILERRFRFDQNTNPTLAVAAEESTQLRRLPVMFCSPTMELGVDISALNTVYLRNVPPTPANYAQRSGRAGRSGQQALVITYCAAQSPHDQWFFRHAEDMVHGVVRPPSLDLTNHDLIESHLQSVWLANTRIKLDSAITTLLEMENEETMALKDEYRQAFENPASQQRAEASAARVLTQLKDELKNCHWFTDQYVKSVIAEAPQRFDQALDRWRTLYRATMEQMNKAHVIRSGGPVYSAQERSNARRRYDDAEQQLKALTTGTENSDFYTYRYLASQGFLPGYNFPRLPLMAWIPSGDGRNRQNKVDGNMVSRPRFLAISEFGPLSLIYHQGSMYRVSRIKLNVTPHAVEISELPTIETQVCGECGYGHSIHLEGTDPNANRCENCAAPLHDEDKIQSLYRIETVETVKAERISIDDEERQRSGFDLQTTYCFLPGPNNIQQKEDAEILGDEGTIATLTYATAARIWRINRGLRRRSNPHQLGFSIDPMTGRWSRSESPEPITGHDDQEGRGDAAHMQRIVPYVEDRRNLLILKPNKELSKETLATLQAALKRGIERVFEIEESELAVEPLPRSDNRKLLLFYEATEGGAGVLTRLTSDPACLPRVAEAALELMHYRKKGAVWEAAELEEDDPCKAGCYRCLLSYYNQPEHELIDRRDPDALKLLVALANARVQPKEDAPVVAGDELLTRWLSLLNQAGYRSPEETEIAIASGKARAAARYKQARALVFFTLPDPETTLILQDKGWQILDFSDPERWQESFAAHPDVFGVEVKA